MVAAVLVILSMGVLTWKGATAKESLGSELVAARCRSGPRSRASPTTRTAVAGATLFAESGCANCHTYLGSGTSNLGAPDLAAIGASGQGAALFASTSPTRRSSGTTSCRSTGSGRRRVHDKQLARSASS